MTALIFLAKAEESLAGAESEVANGRFNNCANRCYYACFQAAITALIRANIRPSGGGTKWGHAFVQTQFSGQLVNRRKLYPSNLADILPRAIVLRLVADYDTDQVTEIQAARALRRTRSLVEAIRSAGGTSR